MFNLRLLPGCWMAVCLVLLNLAGAAPSTAQPPGRWMPVGNMNIPRVSAHAVGLADGRVLVFGGSNASGAVHDAEIFDPNEIDQATGRLGRWVLTGQGGADRTSPAAILLPNGKVYVAGGSSVSSGALRTTLLFDPMVVDPATGRMGTWTSGPALDVGVWAATATLVPSGTSLPDGTTLTRNLVVVAGGRRSSVQDSTIVNTYDADANTSGQVAPMLGARSSHVAALLPDGFILVAGGFESQTGAEVYNLATNQWTGVGSLVPGRYGAASAQLPDGRVVVSGGWSNMQDVRLFNPTGRTWSATANLLIGRHGHHAYSLCDGRVLVTGGSAAGAGSSEIYDPDAPSWMFTPAMVSTLAHRASARLADGRILVAGGSNDGSTANATGAAEMYLSGLTISPEGQSFPAAGGAGTITVESAAGCPWQATTTDDWITITSGAGGTGSGTVDFTVAANAGGARTGSIVIGGLRFTVTQGAVLSTDISIDPVPTFDGWHRTDVTVTLTARSQGGEVQDIVYALSGAQTADGTIAGSTGQIVVTAEGVTELEFYARDTEGHVEEPQTVTIRIDKTLPMIDATVDPPLVAGWNNTAVTVSFTCQDHLSGVALCSGPTTVLDGAAQSVAGTATDRAGNSVTTTVSNINVDRTPPVITFTGNQGVYYLDETIAITCTATDALSGVASETCSDISGPASTFGLGSHEFTATATDVAGNTRTAIVSFQVRRRPCADDVTHLFEIQKFKLDPDSSQAPRTVEAQFSYVGSTPLAGPVWVVVDGGLGAGQVINEAGVTACTTPRGSPYFRDNIADEERYSRGEEGEVDFQFTSPEAARQALLQFATKRYTLRFLQGTNPR